MSKHRVRMYLFLTFSFLFPSLSYTQQPTPQSPTTSDVLTNSDVLKMVEARVSDEIISSKIRTSPCNFDTSIDAILRLKTAGASDDVIKAMVAKAPPKELSANAPPPDPNDPRSPHESGIYWLAKQGVPKRMVRMEASSHPGQKARPGFGTAKIKAVLPGQHAALRINELSPEFWFYFEEKSAGLSQSPSSAVKPEDFTLAKMDANSKERQLIVGPRRLSEA